MNVKIYGRHLCSLEGGSSQVMFPMCLPQAFSNELQNYSVFGMLSSSLNSYEEENLL